MNHSLPLSKASGINLPDGSFLISDFDSSQLGDHPTNGQGPISESNAHIAVRRSEQPPICTRGRFARRLPMPGMQADDLDLRIILATSTGRSWTFPAAADPWCRPIWA